MMSISSFVHAISLIHRKGELQSESKRAQSKSGTINLIESLIGGYNRWRFVDKSAKSSRIHNRFSIYTMLYFLSVQRSLWSSFGYYTLLNGMYSRFENFSLDEHLNNACSLMFFFICTQYKGTSASCKKFSRGRISRYPLGVDERPAFHHACSFEFRDALSSQYLCRVACQLKISRHGSRRK